MTFRGVGTALVTPFTPTGALDEKALERFVDFQIEIGGDQVRQSAGIIQIRGNGDEIRRKVLSERNHLLERRFDIADDRFKLW